MIYNPPKGQVISKGFLVSSISSEKRMNTHRIVYVVKTNSFVHFLEEFTTWQFAFEINWPLSRKKDALFRWELRSIMHETVFTPWQMKDIDHDLFRSITLKYFCTYYFILKPQAQLHIMRQNFLRTKLFQIGSMTKVTL